MKKMMLVLFIICAITSGCVSLRERTTFFPTGQNDYIEGKLDGETVYVRTIVKIDF